MPDLPTHQPDTDRTRSPRSKAVAVAMLVATPLLLAEAALHRGALIDHIPFGLSLAGITCGFLGGLGVDALMMRRNTQENAFKFALAMVAAPLLGGVAGSYYARVAYELIAFTGYTPQHTQLTAPVTSRSTGRGGPAAYVVPYEGARELRVRISSALYDRLDPIRTPGRDCLTLPVEIGRNGVKRAILPAWFDAGVGSEQWAQCPGYSPSSGDVPGYSPN
jgi:hypothetical protein